MHKKQAELEEQRLSKFGADRDGADDAPLFENKEAARKKKSATEMIEE